MPANLKDNIYQTKKHIQNEQLQDSVHKKNILQYLYNDLC